MKNIVILRIPVLLIILASSLFSARLSPTEITKMVAKIKEKRVGISLLELESTVNPFILNVPKKTILTEKIEEAVIIAPKEIVYELKAILNKAAFIDKKWYKQGDSIGKYTVGYISSKSVVLKNSAGNKVLKIEKKNLIKLNRGYK
ncbi:MAG: Unknown protein [uncultured Sulfurovum sp.]|uniref:Uncharacterized protein n=1 Tax=uncultured Sulfurovum sp. TaxID=269237 RepID=A0A6S6T1G3_9BACT|nr:MAG: Unknown protein [uncultured Sulfurovum sp.]